MGAALRCQDAVGEGAFVGGEIVVPVGVVILECDFNVGFLSVSLIVERVRHHHVALTVDVTHHAGNAAVEEETAFNVAVAVFSVKFADQANLQPFVEVRSLTQLRHQPAEVVGYFREYLGVCVVGHGRALPAHPLVLHQVSSRGPLRIILGVAHSSATNFDMQLGSQGVHHRGPDTMQSSGHFVRAAVELTARVQRGHNRFQPGYSGVRMDVNRNAASVVRHAHGSIGGNAQVNSVAVTSERFVHCVIQQFLDQVMQSVNAGAADVHARPHPNGFQAFQYLNVVGSIFR